ncbi:hypothetical protein VPHK567_0067 [Vibrio phage K567]|nr:hypothetical protein MYOV011v1_p0137 [Vibrio phage 6E35.1a]
MTGKFFDALVVGILLIVALTALSGLLGIGLIAFGIFLVSIGWMYTGAFLSIVGVFLLLLMVLLRQDL